MPGPRRTDDSPFATFEHPRRIWAVASVHAETGRLRKLHRQIATHFEPGDRLIYLGNVIGRGRALLETVAELLAFRRTVIAGPGMFASDVVVLRGAQEEMWQKLLQLQFSATPGDNLAWMLDHGVAGTIEAYGGSSNQGLRAMREGTLGVARWTAALRQAMNAAPGHQAFMAALKRAAYTNPPGRRGRTLFVHAGIDTSRPLGAQQDSFWWGTQGWKALAAPFGEFNRIVRGYDPRHVGVDVTEYTLSLDAGAGFGGPLLGACLDAEGNIEQLFEA